MLSARAGRLALLAAIFTVELLAISIWLDSDMLRGASGLAGLVHDWGAFTLRLVLASVAAFLVLGESQVSISAGAISLRRGETGPVSWALLGLHAAAMAAFAGFSSILYARHSSALAANLEVLGWIAAGCAAIVLAACALIPAAVWIDRMRAFGDVLVFAPAAGLGACLLGGWARQLWTPLTHWTFAAVSLLLRPFLPRLMTDPATATIGTAKFNVEIAPECSGYEGMGLVLAVTCAWLWFQRRNCRFPNALALIPAGVALIWMLNAARIAALILIGNAGAEGIAAGGFHSQGGWIAFSMVAVGMCSAARRIAWFTASGAQASVAENGARAASGAVAAYLAPFLAILAAALVSRAVSADFEWLYGLRVAAAGAALWYFRGAYRNLERRISPAALAAGAAVFVLWIALDRIGSAPAAAPAAFENATLAARWAWIALRLAGAIVTVPMAEELAFRGFLLRRLVSSDFESVAWRDFSWIALLVSSLAFGLMHGERWIAGTIAGIVYAVAMLRRGRIADAIAAHAFTNALLAAWVLVTGNWGLW